MSANYSMILVGINTETKKREKIIEGDINTLKSIRDDLGEHPKEYRLDNNEKSMYGLDEEYHLDDPYITTYKEDIYFFYKIEEEYKKLITEKNIQRNREQDNMIKVMGEVVRSENQTFDSMRMVQEHYSEILQDIFDEIINLQESLENTQRIIHVMQFYSDGYFGVSSDKEYSDIEMIIIRSC